VTNRSSADRPKRGHHPPPPRDWNRVDWREVERKLLAGRRIDPASGCWVWTRAIDTSGHGRVHMLFGSTSYRVHRAAAVVWLGMDPDIRTGLVPSRRLGCALSCFNPAHLTVRPWGVSEQASRELARRGAIDRLRAVILDATAAEVASIRAELAPLLEAAR
jgi:hypothetical protein